MSDKCPICEYDIGKIKAAKTLPRLNPDKHGNYCDCRRCGKYEIESHTVALLLYYICDLQDSKIARAKLSHWVRTQFENSRDDDGGFEIVLLHDIKRTEDGCMHCL